MLDFCLERADLISAFLVCALNVRETMTEIFDQVLLLKQLLLKLTVLLLELAQLFLQVNVVVGADTGRQRGRQAYDRPKLKRIFSASCFHAVRRKQQAMCR